MGDLSSLFVPDRIAVIGASEEEGSVGTAVWKNLQSTFDGPLAPVNPNRETVFGAECYDTIDQVDVDFAVVAVPSALAVSVVEHAAKQGVRNIVVITAGFSESGREGAKRESELVSIAEQYDVNLVGPNSLGLLSTAGGLNATFGPRGASPGPISFMSQSGAFITAVLDWAAERDLGFRHVVSLGNKAVLDETDFVEAWGADESTDVILGYLEDVVDGRRFIDVARSVTQKTPVVVVKSGRTEAGATAAASHTGAIAGSEAAYRSALDQAGVLRADSVQSLFDYAAVLAGQPLPESAGVAIVTNAGGPGVMTTDAIGESDLELAELSDGTTDSLSEGLPDAANIYNPIDVLGDASAARFADALEIALDDDAVGMAIVVACPTATLSFDDLAAEIARIHEAYGQPMVAALMGGSATASAADTLSAVRIPTYFDPVRAVDSLAALDAFASIQKRQVVEPTTFDVDRARVREILTGAAASGRTQLGVESMALLDAYGIETPQSAVVDSPDDAVDVAKRIEGDVVMKIVSPDISHKSDIGGVEVGVATADVAQTYENIVTRARNYQPDATIMGVQVQELIDIDAGTEIIVGVSRDPQFGPLVMVGLGGIFVEVMEDTAFRVAPVTEPAARGMFDELRSTPLLQGARGREPADMDALVDTIQRISQLVTDFPAITELDVNPVVALPDDAIAVDFRLTFERENL